MMTVWKKTSATTIRLVVIAIIAVTLNGCYPASVGRTPYMTKNMNRFSVPKNKGVARHFLKNGKRKLSPTYTKDVKDRE